MLFNPQLVPQVPHSVPSPAPLPTLHDASVRPSPLHNPLPNCQKQQCCSSGPNLQGPRPLNTAPAPDRRVPGSDLHARGTAPTHPLRSPRHRPLGPSLGPAAPGARPFPRPPSSTEPPTLTALVARPFHPAVPSTQGLPGRAHRPPPAQLSPAR